MLKLFYDGEHFVASASKDSAHLLVYMAEERIKSGQYQSAHVEYISGEVYWDSEDGFERTFANEPREEAWLSVSGRWHVEPGITVRPWIKRKG